MAEESDGARDDKQNGSTTSRYNRDSVFIYNGCWRIGDAY